MIVLPRWKWTQRIIASPLIAVPPALIYLVLLLPQLYDVLLSLSRPSIDMVADLLGSASGITIGWAHFLAFDLLVGRWIYLDSRERQVHPVWMVPALMGVLLLGPVGYLIYMGVRSAYGTCANG